MAGRITGEVLDQVLKAVPDELLLDPLIAGEFASAEQARLRYREYLTERLSQPRLFLAAAVEARDQRLREPVFHRTARR
jgi:hypothetical protein